MNSFRNGSDKVNRGLSGRKINEFNTTLYIDLPEQDLFMIFDGVDTYIKPVCDFLCRKTFYDQFDNFILSVA